MESIIGTVYGLTDTDGEIFYVGSTYGDPKARVSYHKTDAKSNGSYSGLGNPKCVIIRKCNYKIGVVVIDKSKYESLDKWDCEKMLRLTEVEIIDEMSKSGHKLTNSILEKGRYAIRFNPSTVTKITIETIKAIRKQLA